MLYEMECCVVDLLRGREGNKGTQMSTTFGMIGELVVAPVYS